MAATHKHWVIVLPTGERLKGEDMTASIDRELSELVERGWEVVGFSRANTITPATFVLRKSA